MKKRRENSMKFTWKKLLGALLALTMSLGCLIVTGWAEGDEEAEEVIPLSEAADLRFGADGKFKIIQIADLQESFLTSDLTKDYLRGLAATEKPDLFVLTGDNISDINLAVEIEGSNFSLQAVNRPIVNRSIDSFMKVFEEIGVPVTMVFGNHDTEKSGVTRWQQMQRYQDYSCFVGYAAENADTGTTGNHYGTHNLIIKDNAGETAKFNLWMFDSGDYVSDDPSTQVDESTVGYDCVQKPQTTWFTTTNNAIGKLPSLAFQHIIVRDIFDKLAVADASEKDNTGVVEMELFEIADNVLQTETRAVTDAEGNPTYETMTDAEGNTVPDPSKPITETHYKKDGGKLYKLPEGAKGVLAETPCPSQANHGQYDTLNNAGNVLAMFFGHDHVNTFELALDGTDLVNSPTTGFGSYGNADTRGARVIELDVTDLTKYETRIVTYEALLASNGGSFLQAINSVRYKLYHALGTAGVIFDFIIFKPLAWLATLLGI
jgi:hypothetical protein